MFEQLFATRQTATFRAVDRLEMPSYKGSTIRGAFGHAFRKVSCPIICGEPGSCLLRFRCAYSVCFETPVPEGSAIMRKYTYAPHPFVLEPPDDSRTVYEPGEEFTVGLVLIGRGNDYLAHFIYALDELGARGLGRGRGKAELVRLDCEDSDGPRLLYDRQEGRILGEAPVIRAEHLIARAEALSGRSLRIVFEAPTRMKKDGAMSSRPDFGDLMPGLLRRLSSLEYFHCAGPEDNDVHPLLDAAREVTVTRNDLRWQDWSRYSQRQDRPMQLGGFIGTLECEPIPDALLPMLAWGELLHIGKASAFGLGKYRIE
jgi:hypothetical protein